MGLKKTPETAVVSKKQAVSHLFNSRPFQIVVLASELDHDKHLERSCHFRFHSSPGFVAILPTNGSTVERLLGFDVIKEKHSQYQHVASQKKVILTALFSKNIHDSSPKL